MIPSSAADLELLAGERLFWGNDRLLLLRHALLGGRAHPDG